MKSRKRVLGRVFRVCAGVAVLAGLIGAAATTALVGNFASTTVDIGMVVSDIEKAADFYRNALGLSETTGFDVPADMGGGAGLSDNKSFHVRVFVLTGPDDDRAPTTRLKIMQFPDAPGKKPDNTFIHSTCGVRYLTINVKNITAAIERAQKAGHPVLAKGPCEIPWSKGVFIAIVRDPDGNMIEFVGPKK